MADDRPQHRIAKLLARAGIASRREVERMITDGRVAREGVILDTPATLLASLDGVTVDGEPVAAAEPTRLFLFHKPVGVLTAERDSAGRPTIYDRLPKDLPRLVPVGRLDLNTEGLLLMTTDGGFKRQLELPATGVERSYRARAYGQVSQGALEELIDGIEIDGIRYGSIDANLERRTGANMWIEMTLREGKNREVRRVLEHLGLRVSRLIRTRYGPFVLGDLPVNGVGEVRVADLVAFRQTLKAGGPTGQRLPDVTAQPVVRPAIPQRPVKPRAVAPVRSERPAAALTKGVAPARARPVARPGAAKPGAPSADAAPADDTRERPRRKPGWAKAKPRSGPARSGPTRSGTPRGGRR